MESFVDLVDPLGQSVLSEKMQQLMQLLYNASQSSSRKVMFHRFTDNGDWAEHSNRRKEVVLVLNPSNVFPTNVSKVSLVNARGSGRFAFPLNSRCGSNEDPVLLIVQCITDMFHNGLVINLLEIIVQ